MSLHPEIKNMLEVMYASGWIDPSELTPAQAREQSDRYAKLRQFPQPVPHLASVEHLIPVGSQQTITARVYYPKSQTYNATIVFYHGGGYVISNINQYDTFCRWMCSVLDMPVVSVEYRLAPEYPFPTPIEDGYRALCWVADNAQKLHLPQDNFIVAGDSAGGHLAAMACLIARDKSGPNIRWQWLFYPWVDNDSTKPSCTQFATGFGLSKNAMIWFADHYLKDHHKADYPAFPAQFTDLKNLPASYIIVAENDVLSDEGKAYAEKLRANGNEVCMEIAKGMIHGFINLYALPSGFNTTMAMFEKIKSLIENEKSNE